MNMMTFDIQEVFNKIIRIGKYIFRTHGRIIISSISIVLLIWSVLKGKLNLKEQKLIFFATLFILCYLIFSVLNFYSTRYLLSVFPVLYIVFALLLFKIFPKNNYVSLVTTAPFVVLSILGTMKSKGVGDATLKFMNMVTVHKNVVKYCEGSNFHNKQIATHFLMSYNLKDPFIGYLNNNQSFSKIRGYDAISDSEILVISSIELNQAANEARNDSSFKLLKRFSMEEAWCEIYQKRNTAEIKK